MKASIGEMAGKVWKTLGERGILSPSPGFLLKGSGERGKT